MDAYLQRFERYAENRGWEANCFGTYLGSILSGKALEVYFRLPASEAREYRNLKEALLIQYQLTQEDYQKKFYSRSTSYITNSSSSLIAKE